MTNNKSENTRNTTSTNTATPRRISRHHRGRRKKSILHKTTALALSAVLFGGIAGSTFYGVNGILNSTSGKSELLSDASTDTDLTSTAVDLTTTFSTTAADSTPSSQSLDVADIAAAGLTSVVSVTNISVQEVQNYFGQFGGNIQGQMPGQNRSGMQGQAQTQTQETTSVGSGVIIYSDNTYLYMVSNYHVVEDATTLSVTFADDETYEATLCGYDENRDIAVLKVALSTLSSDTLSQISIVSVGDSDSLTVGEQVVAIGNALGYGQSVTTGIVSAVNRSISSESSNGNSTSATNTDTYIQTDAAINPGNSGGALFNMNGELVGINTAKISTTDVEGMGYAIPISEILDLIESLMK